MAELDDLIEQVHAVSTPRYMQTKAELVAYYKDLQAAGEVKSWKQAIVHDLAEITGLKPKNLERRFDPSRLDVVPRTAKAKAEYEALGKLLPPDAYSPPQNGYVVTFAGSILINGEYCEYREFTINVAGDAAMRLASDPEWSPIFDAYFQMSLADDLCGPATVDIAAA